MKKTLLFLTLLNVFIASAQLLSFTNKSNMPAARFGSALAETDDFAYIVGGSSATERYTSEIYQYNFETDTWTTFSTNLPLIPKRYANAEIFGGKLFVFNGVTNSGINNKLEIIDLFTGEVTMGADNSNPVFLGGSGVDRNLNNIITFGGCTDLSNSVYSNKVHFYSELTNTWMEIGGGGLPVSAQTTGRMINAQLYAIGGYKENNVFTEYFDSAATTGDLDIANWTNLAETGSKLFQGRMFGSNKYAQISAFAGSVLDQEPSNKVWLVSNDIIMPTTSSNEENFLTFNTKDGFNNGATLEAYIITNWTGDPTTSTKTLLTATIASGTITGFAPIFTSSGDISLSNFSNTIRIAFKYTGGYSPVATTLFQIDNVKVFTEVKSNSIVSYDLNNPPASIVNSLPQTVSANAVALDAVNNIFVVGDYDNQNFLGKYNTSNNTFESLSQTDMIARRHCSAAVWNNQLFIFGGTTTSLLSSALNSTQSADFSNLSVASAAEKLSFNLYPNPVQDNLHFNSVSPVTKVAIYDMTGRMVFSSLVADNTIDLSQLKSGQYLIKAFIENEVVSSKLIKN